ncbi:CapA family protein [Bacillus sp. PS06]|uniref:CapA family protein n=1 Tax=Bacillus sp. PS06 TaxID=2764176 RepID=UPI001CD89CBD|nr:CapA family protein [Bacillus sp. PS06]
MKKATTKLTLISLSMCLTILALFLVFFFAKDFTNNEQTSTLKVINHSTKQHKHDFKTYTTSMTLAAIGDLLIHSTVYNDAKTGDTYDFNPMFSAVKEYLEKPDLTIANQETIIGGSEIGLSTYPSFNSPFELADSLKDNGIDIVTIANNHTLDRGEKAILNATNYFDQIGMEYVGGYKSEEDKSKIRVINRNGINISFLSYTYGTNGIPVPSGKEYLVNLIDLPTIKKEISEAKKVSDLVSVSMHWGNEYQRLPSDEQVYLGKEIANAGADIIIGHHPHVLQPMGWIEREDGGQTFIIYSLGNFLSGQMWDYKDIGGILQLDIIKEVTSKNEYEIRIENPTFTSTYVTNQQQQNFRIVPLENAGTVGLEHATSVYNEINDHMFQWLTGDVN